MACRVKKMIAKYMIKKASRGFQIARTNDCATAYGRYENETNQLSIYVGCHIKFTHE